MARQKMARRRVFGPMQAMMQRRWIQQHRASLSACAEAYFAQSEQIPTRFSLAFGYSQEADGTDGWRAGGVMLQHMPAAGSHVTSDAPQGEDGLLSAEDLLDSDGSENWNRANILLDTVDQLELVGPSIEPTQLLLRLFHEEQPRVYDTQPVIFGCTCSSDRVRQSLSIYSAKDIAHMTTDDNTVTADCQFCGAHYSFDPDTLGFEAQTPIWRGRAAPRRITILIRGRPGSGQRRKRPVFWCL